MITVYHGADRPIRRPAIAISEIGREFGIGFYTTPDLNLARAQAKNKAKRGFFYDNPRPVVSAFAFDLESAKKEYDCRSFERFSAEWLDFIMTCYTDIHFVHPHDIVIGPAVTPAVAAVISDYRGGKASRDETLKLLSQQCEAVMQICFCTAETLSCLQFIKEV